MELRAYSIAHTFPPALFVHFVSWMAERTTPEDETVWRIMLEFPVLALSRAAQIRAGLWRRNGPGMQDQVCFCELSTCFFICKNSSEVIYVDVAQLIILMILLLLLC